MELYSFPNSYAEVLTLSTSECDLIQKLGLYRSYQIKSGLLPTWPASLWKGEWQRQAVREDDVIRHKENMVCTSYRERLLTDPSLTALRGSHPADTWISGFQPPEPQTVRVLLHTLLCLLQQPWRSNSTKEEAQLLPCFSFWDFLPRKTPLSPRHWEYNRPPYTSVACTPWELPREPLKTNLWIMTQMLN